MRILNRYCFCILLFTVASTTFSQSIDSPDSIGPTENYVKFTYDNDFFNATDRYYTQGVLATVIHPVLKVSPVFYALIRLKNSKQYFGLTLEQDVFTPKSIRYNGGAVFYGERPFTAVFFLSHRRTSLNSKKKIQLQSQLDLGILGPAALGEEEQKAIHKFLNNIQPLGWENQLSEGYIINYNLFFEKGLVNIKYFDWIFTASSRLGTLYTDAGAGTKFRFGIMNSYFSNLGYDKNSGQGKNNFRIYCHLKGSLKVVGYNATLQGGLPGGKNIYELPDGAVTRPVANISGGLIFAFRKVTLEYSRSYLSPEFSGGIDHGWGRCEISFCF